MRLLCLKRFILKKECRTEIFTIMITKTELAMIKEKAKEIRMSRPNLVVDAVKKYEKEKNDTL